MVLSLLKSLISHTFDKKGIFETMWLSLHHWNKLKVANLRKLLRVETIDEYQQIMRQSIKA
jgi:hypothetical protein